LIQYDKKGATIVIIDDDEDVLLSANLFSLFLLYFGVNNITANTTTKLGTDPSNSLRPSRNRICRYGSYWV